MAFLAFLLAVGSLIWAFRNQAAVRELKGLQFLLQRENARLNDRLNKILAGQEPVPPAPPEPIQLPAPARAEATRRPEPIHPPTPERAETSGRPAPAPILKVDKVDKPAPPSPRLPAVLQPKPAFDWESLVGVKLFSWIAGIALVFAAIFFLRYSVEHGWLGPPIRMAIGLVTGISLLVVCEWKVARRYAVTVNALDGAGIAILFATFFAANSRWELLGVLPTFG